MTYADIGTYPACSLSLIPISPNFRILKRLMIICKVFKNFAKTLKFLQIFFSPSNVEIKTVKCMVKGLNLRKMSEIITFRKTAMIENH